MSNPRRARLMVALRETVAAAPKAQRLELELAVEDYESAYGGTVRRARIAPLFRMLLENIDYGIDLGNDDDFAKSELARVEAARTPEEADRIIEESEAPRPGDEDAISEVIACALEGGARGGRVPLAYEEQTDDLDPVDAPPSPRPAVYPPVDSTTDPKDFDRRVEASKTEADADLDPVETKLAEVIDRGVEERYPYRLRIDGEHIDDFETEAHAVRWAEHLGFARISYLIAFNGPEAR